MPDRVRRDYVNAVCRMIEEGGYESISARKLAKATGYASSLLYRYFESLNFLLCVASVRLAHPYFDLMEGLGLNNPNPLGLNLNQWEGFVFFALDDIPTFENLFLGDADTNERAFEEYMRLFPEDVPGLPDYFTQVNRSFDLRTRDKVVLQQAADKGMIPDSAVDHLADVGYYMFSGLMREKADRGEKAAREDARDTVREFMAVLTRCYRDELLEGAQIPERMPSR